MTLPLSQTQLRQIQLIYRKALRAQRVREQMRGSEYAETFFKLPEETRGASASFWKNRPFQVGVLDFQVSDQIKELWWQKSSRTGATKMIVCGMMQHATHLGRNVGTYLPNDTDRDKFVKVELEPAMRDCDVIHPYRRGTSKTSSENTLSLKMFFGSVWELLGGQAEGNFRGRSPDTAWADEMSAFPINIGGGGSVVDLLDGRVTESVMPKVIGYSSPLLLPHCQVTNARLAADVLMQFYQPCPCCGFPQVLEDYGLDAEFGLKFDVLRGKSNRASAETARYVCMDCAKPFNFSQAMRSAIKGRWQTEDAGIWHEKKDGLLHNSDGPLPGRWSVGLQSNILISPRYGFKRYAHRLMDCLDAASAGDKSKIITFTQTRKGMPWDDAETIDKLESVELLKQCEHYPPNGLIPQGVEVITIFIDVHQKRFEYLIVGWGLGEEAWCLEAGIHHGEITRQQTWDRLKRTIEATEFIREDGVVMNIFKAGIDSGGHWTDLVYKFSKELGIDRLIPCKGILGVGHQIVKYPRKANDQGVFLTTIATDPAKTLTQNRLRLSRPEDEEGNAIGGVSMPGVIHFPHPQDGRYTMFTKAWFNELTAEVRQLKNGKWSWHQTRKNEAFDCMVGNLAVIRICQLPQFGVVLGEGMAEHYSEDPYGNDTFEEEYREAVKDSW